MDSTLNIEILPEHIIDQIKAGEVLERPASLLKELIENSLDAHSTEIDLHLVENGMDLLSIEDNGHGMNFKNLPYAFLRHATSKLKTFEDLYRLHSFGFRGEALASVAASARVTCSSQPKNLDEDGGKIVINGGATELLIAQRGDEAGTSLYIKDLFFNTPARLKFIKSKVSEKAALKKMIYSFALSHPQVTFTVKWDEKERERMKSVEPGHDIERIAQVYFPKKNQEDKIIFCQEEYENYRVKIYFTPNTYATPQYRHHYLFANKRFFQDKSLHHALVKNLSALWQHGESGHYVVDIDVPSEEIDVNVHPNKTQVKFLRADVIYSLLVSALKKGLKEIAASLPSSPAPEKTRTPSLFSREENQDFDLKNMMDRPPASLFAGASTAPERKNEGQEILHPWQKIWGQYILIFRDKPQLIDLKKFLVAFMALKFSSFLEREEAPGPLLISEPFKVPQGKLDGHFEELKSLGLEFDRLNSDYVALRTLPSFMPQVLLAPTVFVLIHYFSQTKVARFERNSFKKFFEEFFPAQLLDLIPPRLIEQSYSDPEILEGEARTSYMVDLTREHLDALFKT